MWLISFVPCQAYLDIYFYKHSQQKLCKEIIFRVYIWIFSWLQYLNQLREFFSLPFNHNANNEQCTLHRISHLTSFLTGNLFFFFFCHSTVKRKSTITSVIVYNVSVYNESHAKRNLGHWKLFWCNSDSMFISSLLIHWNVILELSSVDEYWSQILYFSFELHAQLKGKKIDLSSALSCFFLKKFKMIQTR
jgi:hypothetical protein